MNGKSFFMRALIGLLAALLVVPPGAFAQDSNKGRTYSHEELAQMLAPIALYPDSLLAQVLVASTYPDQIREADIWVKQHPDLKGDALNEALNQQNWDLSVKALVPFPKVLAMMDTKWDWTEELGSAFLAQQADVMATVQTLRARAKAAGNLETTTQQKVVVKGDCIEIQPANPEVVYVPYYDPLVVYGTWLYPAYPPYAYFPYYPGPDFVAFGLFGFAAGIAVGAAWNWGWGYWDWPHRDIDINVTRGININENTIGQVRTASLSRPAGRQLLGAGRTTGTSAATRLSSRAAGTLNSRVAGQQLNRGRPSVASVRNQLSRGGRLARSNQAATRSGTSRLSRSSVSGRSVGTHYSSTRRSSFGGSRISRSSVSGRSVRTHYGSTMRSGFSASHGGVHFAHGGAGYGRVSVAHGGGSFSRGGFAHGGGGGCHGRHC